MRKLYDIFKLFTSKLKQLESSLEDYFPSPAYEKHPAQLPMNQPMPPRQPITPPWKLYAAAVACLKKHITLNPAVPPDLGCAEAVSYVLKSAGVDGVPINGFASTASLYTWLSNSSEFVAVALEDSSPGDIIISPSGSPGVKFPHGHTGILARYGILSNNSYTGEFDESLKLASWQDFYVSRGGFPIYIFRWKPTKQLNA